MKNKSNMKIKLNDITLVYLYFIILKFFVFDFIFLYRGFPFNVFF